MTDAVLPMVLRIPQKEHVTKKSSKEYGNLKETANNQKEVVENLTCESHEKQEELWMNCLKDFCKWTTMDNKKVL